MNLQELVAHAVRAPSGHNTQPWRFEVGENTIEIRPDLSRRLPVVDPDDHALYISLGAALENLCIAARVHGLSAEPAFMAGADGTAIRVTLAAAPAAPPGRAADAALLEAMAERQSTRSRYDGRPIPGPQLRALEAAAVEPGVRFRLFADSDAIETLVPFIEDGNREQMRDGAFVDELIAWVRFNGREVAARGDGLAAATMGMPAAPRWLGRLIMKAVLRPETQARQAVSAVRSSAALALFSAERHDAEHWVRLGRSFERVALTATSLGIRHAHVNMPCEVPAVRRRLGEHLGLGEAEPLLLLRLGYGPARPRAPRRPLQAVLSEAAPA